MKQPRILVDCDGVLADLCGDVCNTLGRYGYKRTPEDFEVHDFDKTLGLCELEAVQTHYRLPGVIEDLPEYDGAQAFLVTIRAVGDIRILTAPWHSPTWLSERQRWLRAFGVGSWEVVACPPGEKPFHAGDVLIEDRADTLLAWCEQNPNGRGVLIDRPWNRGAPFSSRITRCLSYTQAITAVREAVR